MIGYEQKQDEIPYAEHRSRSQGLRDHVAERMASSNCQRVVLERSNLKVRPILYVDGRIHLNVKICPFRNATGTTRRWMFYPHHSQPATDLTLACLLTQDNRRVARVYLIPGDIWRHIYQLDDFERIGVRLRRPSELLAACYDAKLHPAGDL
jgi:hypothetical protein